MQDRKTKPEREATGRRGFFKLAGLGPIAGGVALAAGAGQEAEAAEPAGSGYRETEHVRTVYELSRF